MAEPTTTEINQPDQDSVRRSKDVSAKLQIISQELAKSNSNNGLFIKAPPEYEDFELPKDKQLANLVFNALGVTIKDTCELCLNKLGEGIAYLETAEILSLMLGSLSKIGTEDIRFREDVGAERWNREKNGDSEVYSFQAGPFDLEGTIVDKLTIFIRPSDTIIGQEGSVKQVLQARTKITVQSKSLPTGQASIRIDPPDPRMENNIVFDLAVGAKSSYEKTTIVDELNLSQEAGHHFRSGVNVKDFGNIEVAVIHRAFANRLMMLS